MMVGIQPACDAAFYPDALVYELLQSDADPDLFLVAATFSDDAAFDAHMAIDFHDRLVPPILDCLAEEMRPDFYRSLDWPARPAGLLPDALDQLAAAVATCTGLVVDLSGAAALRADAALVAMRRRLVVMVHRSSPRLLNVSSEIARPLPVRIEIVADRPVESADAEFLIALRRTETILRRLSWRHVAAGGRAVRLAAVRRADDEGLGDAEEGAARGTYEHVVNRFGGENNGKPLVLEAGIGWQPTKALSTSSGRRSPVQIAVGNWWVRGTPYHKPGCWCLAAKLR